MKGMLRSIVLLATLLAGSTALAANGAINIDTVARSANGSLGSAYNYAYQAGQVGSVGCGLAAYSSSSSVSAYCFAYDGAKNVSCVTSDPKLVSVISSLRSDGLLFFQWDANGICTYVHARNDSGNPPKKPQ